MRAKFRRSKAIQETICLCCVVYCSSLLSIQAAEPFKEADSDADKISTAVGYFKKHEYKLADELLTSLLAALTERKDKTWTLVTVLNNLELTCEALGDQKRAEHYKAMRKEITKELDGAPSIVFSSSEPSNPVFMSQKAKVQPRRNVDSTSGTVYQRETQPQYPYAQSLQTRQQIRQPQRKKLISIVRVIALSENDKSLILHPTMGTKEIIDHYETRYSYRSDAVNHPIECQL
ncbi:MAG: hypothetical protein IPL73_23535 [Candidatus Obscuribacter sp.]|nr:hypothetical protein [Candidatus Obscuribacter sp.]